MREVSGSAPRLVRFGVFELDLRSGDLRKAGARVTLAEQPFQILKVLLEQPGELVTRDELRNRLWRTDTFVDFEHGLNAAVKRLRDALSDSAETPRFIETLPRRGYRFIAPVERVLNESNPPTQSSLALPQVHSTERSDVPLPAHPQGVRRYLRYPRKTVVAAIAVLAVVGTGWSLARLRHPEPPHLQVVPLTLLTGAEYSPTFSPDGNQVAFEWQRNPGEPVDIYVKFVGSSEVRRLTTDRSNHLGPSWSPDGRQIAYGQTPLGSNGPPQIHLISALGGADLKLSDLRIQFRPIDWSPDGRYIAAGHEPEPGDVNTGIYLFPISGGTSRRLTESSSPVFHSSPSFSQDGRHLAYVSCSATLRSKCDVFVLDLDSAFAPVGRARRLPRQPPFQIFRTAWTRDGRFVIYDVNDMAFYYLWRVAADGSQPPQRIEAAGIGALFPATARSGDRLAFSRVLAGDEAVYRFEVGRQPEPVFTSTSSDSSAQFSPDGRQVAFCSNRSGTTIEVWVGAADGSDVQQLTHGSGQWQCSPRWSPDGQRVAFDSKGDDGHWHIWVIDAHGGIATQVTKDAGDQNTPSWSRDREWIYFSWDQGTGRDIWRRRPAGGPAERVTMGGAAADSGAAIESVDGQNVLYQPRAPDGPLLIRSLASGTARQIIPCVAGTAFDTGPQGIYYVACGPGPDPEVHVMDPATGLDRTIGRLQKLQRAIPSGFTVSPDGRSILYTKVVSDGAADLMLIENFR